MSTPSIPTATSPGSRYFPALDGIRALAILLVIPHNATVLTGPIPDFAYPAMLLVGAGWVGVQLFFVLSGFLITGALLDSRESEHYYGSFFWRRALRILPLYYLVMLAVFVIAPLFITMPENLRATDHNQFWLWVFLSNWTEAFGGSVFGFSHFWSLAVEEQFYLLWPFIVRRATPVELLRFCIAIAFAALLIRWGMKLMNFPKEALYMFTICRMDALGMGAAVAAAIRIPSIAAVLRQKIPEITALALIVLAFGALITHTYNPYDGVDQTIGYLLLSVGFALILLPAVFPTTGVVRKLYGALAWNPLRAIGRYSYAMYILHYPFHAFVGEPLLHRLTTHVTPLVALGYTLAVILISFTLGALSYHFFERHFLRLKSLFPVARSPKPA